MSPDTLLTCSVCKGPVRADEARIDTDLQAPVCADCLTQLRWSQAYLKISGIHGCTRAYPVSYRLQS